MASILRTIIANIGLFQADNNVRRNIGSFSLNYGPSASNPNPMINRATFDLAPGASQMFNANSTYTSCTVVRAIGGPVDVEYVLNALPTRPVATTVQARVNSFLMLDDAVGQFKLSNPATAKSSVTIHFLQG